MITCLEGVLAHPVFWGVVGISAVAACVMIWMLRFQNFNGKAYFALTFIAMIWTLMMVGSEAASISFSCQFQWATMAWLGNALLPVAWCFFVFSYVDNAPWLKRIGANAILIVVPTAIFAIAATNQWHNLIYTGASIIPPGENFIDYSHGPGFRAIIATLYVFVFATLFCLVRAFTRSTRAAWPLLTMLVLITASPLIANIAYVGFGFTVFGIDPTAFIFTFGIFNFAWLLVTNKTMDMASVGKSILFNTMSEPVVLIDNQRNIVLMNSAAKRSALHQGSERILNDVLANIEHFNASEGITHLNIGGRVYEPRVTKVESPIDPQNSALGWSVTFVDLTDRIAISSALEKALRKADAVNNAKDEFISVVSHELRTPLTSLKGGLALALSGRLGDMADPVHSMLELVQRNGIRLSRLVDNILLSQKIDIDALSLENEPVDLANLLQDSLDENRLFAAERGVQLSMAKNEKPAVILGDAFAVRQIIDNLISNAIKFSKNDSSVDGSLHITDGRVRLSIKDTGRGIPQNMEGKVFGRFEQVKTHGQNTLQGSGLGLHISQQLAMKMSGEISYESQLDIGTTFHIDFLQVDTQEIALSRLAVL